MNASFPPCNFNPVRYNPSSTPEDLFITYAFKKCNNLASLARTFRHTGTNASAVFFVDNDANNAMTDDTRNLIHNCGISLINLGNLPYIGGTNYYVSAFMYMIELIRLNSHKINRVIKSDGFDTFFQGDPFIERFTGDTFLIFDEHWRLGDCHINKGWVERYGYKITEKDYNFGFKCAGFTAGSADIFTDVYNLFISFIIPDDSYTDQGAFNYFMLSGIFDRYYIPAIEQKGMNNIYVRHMARDKYREYEILGNYTTNYNSDLYALVVHHSYHASNVKKYCPQPPGNFPNYMNVNS